VFGYGQESSMKSTSEELKEVTADDFSRRFSQRSGNLMWFLGAGVSASAGIPTASHMIWDFKQHLYASQRRVSVKTVSDLSSPAIRAQLQAHIDSLGTLPAAGAADEYAALFEATYPAEADRRTYIDAKITGAKPSYGHMALATLMKAGFTRIVWTTNFDPLVADACAKVYDATGPLTTIALDAPELAAQKIEEGRWPIEIKVHGDFRSRRLKNTTDELRHQDAKLRQILVNCCRRWGLVVAGYSGRDASVMDALEDALSHYGAFPAGLFWLHHSDNVPFARVEQLLTKAATAGIEAALVRIENFDETMRDLLRMIPSLDTSAIDAFAINRRWRTGTPFPRGNVGWPVIRLNAIPIVEMPNVCRRVVCSIGGHSEAKAAIEAAEVDALVARTKAGVLAFGNDGVIRSAFHAFGITDFDLHTIESKRLRYDSGERGLLREALTRALSHHHRLKAIHRRSSDLLAPLDPSDPNWAPLRNLVGQLNGTVTGFPELQWQEGIGTRLDWANDRLWLLIEPRTIFEGINDENRAAATDFARERTVRRYNRQLNELIAFWANIMANNSESLRALGISDGVDAVFRLSSITGFSRRVGA
jgi:hypothetical protein